MCSTQCDAPVIPGCSFLEPTVYQTQTLAVGLSCIGAKTTLRPLERVNERVVGRAPAFATIARDPSFTIDNVPPTRA